ncbi:hypothetical protein BJ875DRAFT_399470 [Amylocarpus encephaloides]|uniref:Neosartoricin B biosynthesis protein A n=1 Tax=Amylocarpus encephaloides TaxID=45428 RepID=A0A9P7YKE0_9HELO|nr:hypothetical protein BJ875DRAFT_399470 [Amylocarpus encephaloides]
MAAQRPEVEAANDSLEPIAIIGFSFKFPQDADTSENFWQMLVEGRSAMTEVPKDRWNSGTFYHPDPERHDCTNVKGGHFLKEDVALFDAPFFSLPPDEAKCMDPQQRSLLECSYHALENSGVQVSSLVGTKTSVYVGSMGKDYERILQKDPQLEAKYLGIGTGTTMLANRLSWFYDLRGPSFTLDTACSSGLNALHLAVQSIRARESDLSIVGGCNIILTPDTSSIPLSNLGMLGPDGVCYSFDHRANGYGRGEGTAIVILKSLTRAIEDGDTIRAVIRNTGVNQDGRTPGITQPSTEAQAALIAETYSKAGLSVDETGYFEAHGTGTALGDPREAAAIGQMFKDNRESPLIVGTVKSNIGHLEGAAGLAGLIKTVMILEKGVVPPNIWFEKVNPEILVDDLNIQFPTKTASWPRNGLRRASVNSFGYGGSNAHVILDDTYHYLQSRGIVGKHRTITSPLDFDSPETLVDANGNCNSTDARPRLFVWSAADEVGLERIATKYVEYFAKRYHEGEVFIGSLSYTLTSKINSLPWKSFLVADSVDAIQHGLSSGQLTKPVRSSSSSRPDIAFVFTGQGAQWFAMGRELSFYPTFQKSLVEAERYLISIDCQWRLTEELNRSWKTSKVNNPAIAQPACTALQIALVDLLQEWRIVPISVVGHSSGEIAAAYCAGAISRESAWKIAYFRGALAATLVHTRLQKGSMVAVALSQTEIEPYLTEVSQKLGTDRLAIGCVNSPQNLTLTGDAECVDLIKSFFDRDAIFARKLAVPVAYHSSHMEDISDAYQGLIHDITPGSLSTNQPTLKFFSSVTGRLATREQLASPIYWVANMVSKVNFSAALSELCRDQSSIRSGQNGSPGLCLIEVGPHSALRRPIKEILGVTPASGSTSYHCTLQQEVDACKSLVELAGSLYCLGHSIGMQAIQGPDSNRSMLCDLPEYPFNHSQAYWVESRLSQSYRLGEVARHDLLGVRELDWNPSEAKWRNVIRVSELPWIKDHKFNGSELYPAAGMLVMAIEAARQLSSRNQNILGYSVENVQFLKPLLISLRPEGVETRIHFRPDKSYQPTQASCNFFSIYLLTSGNWVEVCHGNIVTSYQADILPQAATMSKQDPASWSCFNRNVAVCSKILHPKDLYNNLTIAGIHMGPTFQTLRQISYDDNSTAAAFIDPHDWRDKVGGSQLLSHHVIHPTALDAVLHLAFVAGSDGTWGALRPMVPAKIDQIWISHALLAHRPDQTLQACVQRTFKGHKDTEFQIQVYDNLTKECQISLGGYRVSAIGDFVDRGWKRICCGIEWKPDVELLCNDELSAYCDAALHPDNTDFEADGIDRLELLCYSFIQKTLDAISTGGGLSDATHIGKYVGWMKKTIDGFETSHCISKPKDSPSLNDDAYFDTLVSGIGSYPEADLILEVGRNLLQVLRGNLDPLSVVYSEHAAKGVYDGATFHRNYDKVAAYVDLLAHKSPTLEILEIGAGTGGCTSPILHKLATHGEFDNGQARFNRYTYTDISPGFFEGAKDRFRPYLHRMEFRTFNVEQDPISQGLNQAAYDVVVMSAVLHAAADLNNALANIRKLLRPNGSLILVEPCNLAAIRIPFIFGLLPSWWSSVEATRYWGPLLSSRQWHETLLQAGFSGADVCLQDFEDHRHAMSTIISKLPGPSSKYCQMPRLVILVANRTEHPKIVEDLMLEFAVMGGEVEIIQFAEVCSRDLIDAFCISLLEWENPFFYDLQHQGWDFFQLLARTVNGILWLTRGRQANPAFGLVTGLGRALRTENRYLNFVDLALEANTTDVEAIKHILAVLNRSINAEPVEQNESEYSLKNGKLCINRITEVGHLNDYLHQKQILKEAEVRSVVSKSGEYLSLTIKTPGLLNTLEYVEAQSEDRSLAPDELNIDVKASGVSYRDVLIATGKIPANSLGLEFAGIIVGVGHNITLDQFQVGDRVCGIAFNSLSTRVRSNASATIKIPHPVSFNTAAGLPLTFGLAYHGLMNTANLNTGESIMILSAAGAVGQAAIQLAKFAGANIYCTVGSEQKKFMICDRYSIPHNQKSVDVAISLNIYTCSAAEEAFRFVQSGNSTGKTVIQFEDEDVVHAVPSNSPNYYFNPDATYVIVGGLGGLGKRIALWMVSRKAKHLLLLGRSGAKGAGSQQFLEDLSRKSVVVQAPSCDITSEEALLAVLENCANSMPPIRGCIQGSMVLRDGLFEAMSLDDFNQAVNPKSRGSWNLHNHLPKGLDFFVLLASTSGITGAHGQSNYAAGNTYEDALAHYRVSLGQKCVSLNLGLVLSVGFAAENLETLDALKKGGYDGIEENNVLAILDYVCDSSLPINASNAQIIAGLDIPTMTKDTGGDAQDGRDHVPWSRRPLFRHLTATSGLQTQSNIVSGASQEKEDFQATFIAAASTSVASAAQIVAKALCGKLARMLWMPEEDIDVQKPTHSYGVDSLVAVELRHWLGKEILADVSIFEIMGDESLAGLSLLIAQKSKLLAGSKA